MKKYIDDGIFDGELAFYKAYKENENEPVSVREAACFTAIFQYYFRPIQRGDLLAGRVHYLLAGISAENTTGGLIVYCKDKSILKKLEKSDVSPAYKQKVEEMIAYLITQRFLDDESSDGQHGKMPDALPPEVLSATANSVADMQGRVAGSIINYDKLITRGIPGLIEEVNDYKRQNAKTEEGKKYGGGSKNSAKIYDSMLNMLSAFQKVCLDYARQARQLAGKTPSDGTVSSFTMLNTEDVNSLIYEDTGANKADERKNKIEADKQALVFTGGIFSDGSIDVGTHIDNYTDNAKWKAELKEMAECLENIATKKPASMREGLQLAWLYSLGALTSNYGRMDIYAGDLYVQDIKEKRLTPEKALELVQCFWRLTVARRIAGHETAEFNARVVVGGKGRRNTENADEFALLAMEATRTIVETEPQLTLRIYDGMNETVMQKALEVIGEGRIYPMLYNDDVNIPGVAKAFNVSEALAALYYPYGCGEYVLEHTSIGSPNCSLNTLKALEITLHNGIDPKTNKQVGLQTGLPDAFDTFDKLWDAYKKQIEYFAYNLGVRHGIEYEVEASQVCFLLTSILYDGCLEKGRGLCDRGPIYSGSVIESFALVNTGDSLNTIKQLVYDMKLFPLKDLVDMLDNNFEDHLKEHKMISSIPKYGNDDDKADEMVMMVTNHLADYCHSQAENIGLDYFLIVNINNWFNVELAKNTGASADGRYDGDPFANGNTPTAGNDHNGVTAMMNSLAKFGADNHAGYSHNMKFNKSQFISNKDKIRSLLDGYWKKGGTQAMITAVSRGDLEDAMENPSKYANLIVRVGGFSARFIELRKDIQLDLINRTMHDI